MKNIGIIGFGNMGRSFALGLEKSGSFRISVYEKEQSKISLPAAGSSLTFCANLKELADKSEIIMIAIKPQDLVSLLKELKPLIGGKHVISIAAGKKISFFEQGLGTSKISRFMPNLGASVNASATGVAFGEKITDAEKSDALEVAQSTGTALVIPEKLMSAITGVCGSGIAYVFRFIHALSLGGTLSGLSYADALKLSLSVVEGAVKVLRDGGINPEEMLSKVISPAGTTIAGIKVLEDTGFTSAVMGAVKAAADRADQLEQ